VIDAGIGESGIEKLVSKEVDEETYGVDSGI